MKKLFLVILIFISSITFSQEVFYWADTTGGKVTLRQIGIKYPLPIQEKIIGDTSKVLILKDGKTIIHSIPMQIIGFLKIYMELNKG